MRVQWLTNVPALEHFSNTEAVSLSWDCESKASCAHSVEGQCGCAAVIKLKADQCCMISAK